MRESSVWDTLKTAMGGLWSCTRIESSAGNGVPDVSFALQGKHGWVELKYVKEWPKRNTTKVKLPLRPEQKLWMQKQLQHANNIWVFIRIENWFFLLTAEQAVHATLGWTRDEWMENAYYKDCRPLDYPTFQQMFMMGVKNGK